MKVDIHAHTELYTSDSRISPSELLQMAEASGYEAIFLTERNRVWPRRELAALREHCDRVQLFAGIERSFPQQDILVLGAADPVYESLETPHELLAQACADGFLTVISRAAGDHAALPAYCELVDAVEVSSCLATDSSYSEGANRYAEAHHMAPLFGSDAYGLNYLNVFWIETPVAFRTPQEFRNIVLSRQYRNRRRPEKMQLPPAVKIASMADMPESSTMGLLYQPIL